MVGNVYASNWRTEEALRPKRNLSENIMDIIDMIMTGLALYGFFALADDINTKIQLYRLRD